MSGDEKKTIRVVIIIDNYTSGITTTKKFYLIITLQDNF